MQRIPSAPHADGLESQVADAAPFMAEFLQRAEGIVLVFASAEGLILDCNPAAARRFGDVGATLWDRLETASAARLRACLASGERNPEARLLLKVAGGGAKTTLQCRIDLRPGGFLLLGEHGEDIDAAALAEMTSNAPGATSRR